MPDLYAVPTTLQDAPGAACEGLQNFIAANIPGLMVLSEWPYATQKLTYPSLTIFQGQAPRTPLLPETVNVTAPDTSGQVVVTEEVAEYDLTLQLDLWCRNKLERSQNLAKLISLFEMQRQDPANSLNKADGLTLQLTGYFNTFARYDIQNHQHQDDEQAAERQERREKISVLVNCRELRTRTYYAIKQSQVSLGVGSSDTETANLEIDDLDISEDI